MLIKVKTRDCTLPTLYVPLWLAGLCHKCQLLPFLVSVLSLVSDGSVSRVYICKCIRLMCVCVCGVCGYVGMWVCVYVVCGILPELYHSISNRSTGLRVRCLYKNLPRALASLQSKVSHHHLYHHHHHHHSVIRQQLSSSSCLSNSPHHRHRRMSVAIISLPLVKDNSLPPQSGS